MKVTLPDGTVVEGTREELQDYLPPTPKRNWDGSLQVTSDVGVGGVAASSAAADDGMTYVESYGENAHATTTKNRDGTITIVEKCPDGVNERTTVVDAAGYIVSESETLVAVPRKYEPMQCPSKIRLS